MKTIYNSMSFKSSAIAGIRNKQNGRSQILNSMKEAVSHNAARRPQREQRLQIYRSFGQILATQGNKDVTQEGHTFVKDECDRAGIAVAAIVHR